jgi:hypothetical protein
LKDSIMRQPRAARWTGSKTSGGGKPRKGNGPDQGGPNKRGRGTRKTPVVAIVERN